ncbi:MAG: NYN domain-containing protein [Actinomycetaceae bacterium]|nr:NYN domain-containing protein [Actinomycetaceae bacterium]
MLDKTTYVVIDGENIDATLGMSVLGHRPESEERPRWDRILEYSRNHWNANTKGLFFLNASSGHLPMGFIQALMAMGFTPVPLSSDNPEDKVVDIGIQRTLEAIIDQGHGDVILGTHDADFLPHVDDLLRDGRRVGVMCFREFLSSQFNEAIAEGLEVMDLEYDIEAFQVPLPRLHIIPLDEFDPRDIL